MEEDPHKDDISYADILHEDIERKLNRIKIHKEYLTYINNYKNSLDSNILQTSTEDTKRRKKVVNTYLNDTTRLDDDDVVEDLNSISKESSDYIRILGTNLYIKNHKYTTKGDKVLVKYKKDEYVGTIVNVDDNEVTVKSKDSKRNKIKLSELKKHVISIQKYTKK